MKYGKVFLVSLFPKCFFRIKNELMLINRKVPLFIRARIMKRAAEASSEADLFKKKMLHNTIQDPSNQKCQASTSQLSSSEHYPEAPQSAFKSAFKKFKSRTVEPDMTNVFNPRAIQAEWKDSLEDYPLSLDDHASSSEFEELGLKPQTSWKAVTFKHRPGLIILPNIFTKPGVSDWIYRCTKEFPQSPNVTNLHSHQPESIKNWNLNSLPKLRWVTLGYHYDWTKKIYTEESRTEIPAHLTKLSTVVAKALGFSTYNPEAVIANYYHKNSTLSGHVDESEWNLEAPLLSFSFGNTAIYLQGGLSLNEDPLPFLLQSGDVMVMHKGQRLVYHGVPKVIQDSEFQSEESKRLLRDTCQKNDLTKEEENIIMSFSEFGRVNLTVRQMK